MQWRRCVLQNIRNLAGQQITQNSAAHTRDQTHKCDQQKLICIQKTDGCFHTEDCKCCKSEGVRQKQQVVVHNIGTAGNFFGNRMAVVVFQMINTTTAVMVKLLYISDSETWQAGCSQ